MRRSKKVVPTALAIVGYLIVVWYYVWAFAPFATPGARHLLWYACVSCSNFTNFRDARIASALMYIGPLNALIYAAIGYLLVTALLRVQRK